jgi:hypothetical protein
VGSRAGLTAAPLTARVAALAYAGVGVYATREAIMNKEPARFGGRKYPGASGTQFLWLGTGLSAPVYVLAGYVRAGLRGDDRMLRALAAATLAGQLGEPITWRGANGRQRAIVAANIVLPAVVMVSLRRRRRAVSRP